MADKELIYLIQSLTFSLFGIKPSMYDIFDKRANRKKRYKLQIDNSVIHTLLFRFFDIPTGYKASIVDIPTIIRN